MTALPPELYDIFPFLFFLEWHRSFSIPKAAQLFSLHLQLFNTQTQVVKCLIRVFFIINVSEIRARTPQSKGLRRRSPLGVSRIQSDSFKVGFLEFSYKLGRRELGGQVQDPLARLRFDHVCARPALDQNLQCRQLGVSDCIEKRRTTRCVHLGLNIGPEWTFTPNLGRNQTRKVNYTILLVDVIRVSSIKWKQASGRVYSS
ncbi:hypothetical protein LZ30DRAFT_717660 [Colletotrichum cereale]|nr:hypothetical protein LZ30DRAFT_717660 [Colletotrichum cereale]